MLYFATEANMQREFTAVIEKRGRWYVAYVEEIPGVNTQGRTLSSARRNLREALRLILDANRRLARKHSDRRTRRELERPLARYGCQPLREGSRHSLFYNPENERTSTIARHKEVDDFLSRKICRDLKIPPPR